MNTSSHFQNPLYLGFTLGTVVDTNDPQQCGRLRIMVPSYGDRPTTPVKDIPWAIYISPFGGTVNNEKFKRGPEEESTPGPVGYGLWNIPKIGATVVVTCLDGNPMSRAWIGCVHTERLSHTLPHGRYITTPEEVLQDGPLDSTEQPIQPLYNNYTKAFGERKGNYEWRTRGVDYSVSSTSEEFYLNDGVSKKLDDKEKTITSKDGKSFVVHQGYSESSFEPNLESINTIKNFDSSVYSWTTPGFHSISMDDRKENCRMHFRTTSGHQIILDDTNERIYINTCEGRNWIELDQDGNIHVYSNTRISVRSEGDINFFSDKTIRLYAEQAIHMYSKNMFLETGSSFNIKSGDETKITANKALHLKSKDKLLQQGTRIHLNGPAPSEASGASFPTRIPSHEPWARCNTAGERSLQPKYNYDDPKVGTDDKERGKYWRR